VRVLEWLEEVVGEEPAALAVVGADVAVFDEQDLAFGE
jgi:hypothetical protein